MERYGEVVLYAMPVFFLLILVEKWWGWRTGKDFSPTMDMLSGVQSGLTNAVKDVLQLSITILSYGWLVEHVAIWQMPHSVWMYVLVFVVLDFQGYWVHRWAHEINFFWNKHLIHHSSEEFNLAVALRQSVSSFVSLFTFFLLPCALVGVPGIVIATIAPLHLFAQFWYHTRHIDTMGILEKIIVTPSHHRVHHAVNPEYLDKNYGQIFIFWDKWFGTFQAELPEVPPVYGITRPAATWNPIKINFQHLFLMARDAFFTKNWWDKLRLWWMPTGWRPADVAARFPVKKIENVFDFEKYNPPHTSILRFWAVAQTIVIMLLSAYFFGNIAKIGSPGIFIYGLFLFASVFSLTELMDKNRWAWLYELLRVGIGVVSMMWWGGWFGVEKVIPFGSQILIFYLMISMMGVFFLLKIEGVHLFSKKSEIQHSGNFN